MINQKNKYNLPEELDDAIYRSLLNTPEKWKVTYMKFRGKDRYNLTQIIRGDITIQIGKHGHYCEWKEKQYWCHIVSDRILQIVESRINDFLNKKVLTLEEKNNQHLQMIISNI